MRALLRRYKELVFVAFLLAAPLVVYGINGRKPARLNLFDRGVVQLTAPAEKLIVWVSNGLVDGFQSYLWLRGVREENLQLRRRVVRQEQEVSLSQETRLENERLRKLASLRERLGNVHSLAAEVIGVGASPHSHTLRISRGLRDGILRGAPVLSPEGVVGTVAQLADGYADVQLIVSPFSAVAAINQRTRGRSTVKGVGDIERCKLEYARRTEELAEGDMMLTAGGAGSFPKGLRIGKVIDVQKKPYGLFQSATVVPAVDFSRLDEVIVVLLPPEPEPASPPGAPALVGNGAKSAADGTVPASTTAAGPAAVPAVAPLTERTP